MDRRPKALLRPILCYPGGKQRLVPEILKRMPEHEKYVEPFFGGGSVFFAKSPSKKEVIADLDRHITDFHGAFQGMSEANFKRCDLRYSREKFLKLREKHKSRKKMGPCEFLSLNKLSFGCKGESLGRGTRPGRQTRWAKAMNRPRFGISHVDRHFKELQGRLKQAKIEASDFRKTIRKHDSLGTFFYLDPPYFGNPGDCVYGKCGGCQVNPDEVCGALRSVKGRFLLSYNDHPEVRKACRGFKIERVKTDYTINKGRHDVGRELLIRNY